MAIKNTLLGGTDWTDEILYSADLNDTFNAITTPLDTGLNITRDSATGSAPVVTITQDNAGDDQFALKVIQDGDTAALVLNHYGTSRVVLSCLAQDNAVYDNYANFVSMNTKGTGLFYRNLASAVTEKPVVEIIQDNAGDNQDVLTVTQAGSGNAATFTGGNVGIGTSSPSAKLEVENSGTNSGLFINQDGNGISLDIDSETTTLYGIRVLLDTLTSATGFLLSSDSASAASANGLAFFRIDNTSATTNVLKIQNDGTGNGILIDQNGDAIGLNINNAGTANGLFIDQDGAGVALNIDKEGAGVGVNIDQSAAGGNALVVTNAGAGKGLNIIQSGAGNAIEISQSGDADAIDLNQSGDGDGIDVNMGGTTTEKAGVKITCSDTTCWNMQLGTTSPADPGIPVGAFWFDGSNLKFKVGATIKTITWS